MIDYSIEGAEIIAALTVGALFGVFGNMLVTLYFRKKDGYEITSFDKIVAIILFACFVVYMVVSALFLLTQMAGYL